MLPKIERPDPYSSFRNDRERRIALISRDVRYVLVVVAIAATQEGVHWRELLRWIGIAA